MPTARESILRGPGSITYDSQTVFDRDGIDAAIEPTTFDVMTSLHGVVDTRLADAVGSVSLTPSGRATAGLLAMLFPYGNPTIGASMGGATDKPLAVHSLSGRKLTMHAAYLTQLPQLRLSARQTLFGGAAQFTAVLKNGVARTDANSMYTIADDPWDGDYAPADVKTLPHTAAWGAGAPWDAIKTAEGWTIDFEIGTEPVLDDAEGTIDHILTSVTARARCRPIGLTEANVLDALKVQGADNAIGTSRITGNNLVIQAAGGITVTLHNAGLVEGPVRWGNTDLRIGEIGFVAHRSFTEGAPGPVYSVAMTA
jgi:hypothetical protein